jgi:hypothetical protein
MGSVLTAEPTILIELQFVRSIFLIFGGGIVPLLAFGAGEGDDITHSIFLKIPSRPGREGVSH